MGMVRWTVDGNLFTAEGPGVEPVEAAATNIDPQAIVVGFLDSIEPGAFERATMAHMEAHGMMMSPTEAALAVLREQAGGG